MITKDFLELCLSPRVEEPKPEVNKLFIPEQQSSPVYLYLVYNSSTFLKNSKKHLYPIQTTQMTAFRANNLSQTESLLESLQQATGDIGIYMNANKTENKGAISTVSSKVSKIGRPVHIPRQQHLIDWKGCQHTLGEGVECCWLVIGHMEVWSIRYNKKGFIPNCCCVLTTIWMHQIDANKTHWEKARCQPHKEDTCCLVQIQEETSNKIASVLPPASYLKNYLSNTNKTCGSQLEK